MDKATYIFEKIAKTTVTKSKVKATVKNTPIVESKNTYKGNKTTSTVVVKRNTPDGPRAYKGTETTRIRSLAESLAPANARVKMVSTPADSIPGYYTNYKRHGGNYLTFGTTKPKKIRKLKFDLTGK
tara:strand:- start:1359 stop:1739 length:381 start_codon:yes stop_codon:yes gene_type:complete